MSPPYTTPPPQNPSKASKKQDAIMDGPNTNPKTTMENFFAGLKNYKQKKPLADLAVLGMTIIFWQHGDKNYTKFEYGKLLVPKHDHVKLSWIM
jgi:hypothetical protein